MNLLRNFILERGASEEACEWVRVRQPKERGRVRDTHTRQQRMSVADTDDDAADDANCQLPAKRRPKTPLHNQRP
ncbi:hypothetical protein LSTR_LSTR002343 [Laodelphax striatellus]|uniref:Uncharacterized protein n=1 Tax=Laodelphax striatellus TaxID=195883 RepID=A0A482X3H4_LAOST|nr:hypothetical protein LSTR_LSTR002343 [Laodelphax striatellus]